MVYQSQQVKKKKNHSKQTRLSTCSCKQISTELILNPKIRRLKNLTLLTVWQDILLAAGFKLEIPSVFLLKWHIQRVIIVAVCAVKNTFALLSRPGTFPHTSIRPFGLETTIKQKKIRKKDSPVS